jgi:hypothetical protein
MNRSKERHTFQAENYIKRCEETGEEPSQDYLGMYEDAKAHDLARDADEEWKKNNLEYDLRSTEWICAKAKAREEYAQNIYAALCNQDWQRNAVWPLLKGQTWSCSWRYAGGIVADMREQGDYMDWYCSGIRGGTMHDDAELTNEQRARIEWYDEHFVSESHVTDEIREDFFKLGWIPVENNDDE